VSVRFKDLSFRYGPAGEWVLKNLNLHVKFPGLSCIMGASGCGKSTLLRLLCGLEKPSSGTIDWDASWTKQAAVVFQNPTLLEWRTVLTNVLLPREIQEQSISAKAQDDARHWLQTVGLAGFENHHPRHLSGGMKMRTALARALLNNSQCLLLDEPFAALDEPTREQLNAVLMELQAQLSLGVVLVTHSIREATSIGTQLVVLDPSTENGCAVYVSPRSPHESLESWVGSSTHNDFENSIRAHIRRLERRST
jgi:NitT/TauT family transport system ATP-binding protein